MFALGAAAEYRRPDRDLFVNVKLENVKPNMKRLFTKVPNGNTYGLPYDHFSVMAVSVSWTWHAIRYIKNKWFSTWRSRLERG